jgi:hypothetical protein
MKNHFGKSIAILGLFFVLATATAQAQTASRVEANIPFDFTVGKANLKAGAYSVKRLSNNALSIRRADGKTTALVNAPLTIGAREARAGERLVFNKYGDQYFLSQIWMTPDSGRQLFSSGTETKAAREFKLAHRDAKPERVEVSVRSN